MSRICVKNLPKHANESKLKELFSTRGEITDVRIVKTAKGESRLFGFVGFRTSEQALAACQYFNNTFIGSSKITVEIAVKVGDSSIESNALSKHTKKKIAKDLKSSINKEACLPESSPVPTKGKLNATNKDEFMEVMKSRKSGSYWANDEVSGPNTLPENKKRAKNGDDESDGDSDDSNDLEDVNDIPLGSEMGSQLQGPGTSDMDFLRSKVNPHLTDRDKRSAMKRSRDDKETKSDHVEEYTDVAHETEGNEQGTADHDNSGRLFVRNLPFSCTEEEIKAAFESFGPVSEVHLPLDSEKRGKGFGFIEFMIPEHADKAKTELDGSSFQGRLLHVLFAKEKLGDGKSRTHGEDGLDEDTGVKGKGRLSAFQLKKDTERKAMAGATESWNSSFVRSEAVVSSLAEKYGVKRSDILSTGESGGELAIRMAIGEAHVIAENKDFFRQHGVDITALESTTSTSVGSKRSPTTLLIKNLPPDVVESDLEANFSRFGAIAAFLMPPSKTVALVEFVEPTEARAAFKGLAYRKYMHLPLYIEWAPLGVINKANLKNMNNKTTATTPEAAPSSSDAVTRDSVEDPSDSNDFSTIYIKNLSFNTDEAALMQHLQRMGCGDNLRQVSIPKKLNKTSGQLLSMGFGFAEFRNGDAAGKAVKLLSESMLDGHAILVKPSDKRLSAASVSDVLQARGNTIGGQTPAVGSKSGKLIVRNVAFQATQTELRSLFAAFGTVKRVRIPKKMGGVHRGFAFVEFSSAQEAATAITALGNTHLYGRHLILEWAKEDEDLQNMAELRKRALVQEKIVGINNKRPKKSENAGGEDEQVDLGDEMY